MRKFIDIITDNNVAPRGPDVTKDHCYRSLKSMCLKYWRSLGKIDDFGGWVKAFFSHGKAKTLVSLLAVRYAMDGDDLWNQIIEDVKQEHYASLSRRRHMSAADLAASQGRKPYQGLDYEHPPARVRSRTGKVTRSFDDQ